MPLENMTLEELLIYRSVTRRRVTQLTEKAHMRSVEEDEELKQKRILLKQAERSVSEKLQQPSLL